MKKLLVVLGLIVSFDSYAMDGNGFFAVCDPPERNQLADFTCMAYLRASTDLVLNGQKTFQSFSEEIRRKIAETMKVSCMPTSIETNQVKMISIKWYRDHPDRLNNYAISEIREALEDSFPCKQ